MRFEQNAGQWDEGIRFLARADGMMLALTDDGPVLRLGGGDAARARLNAVASGAPSEADVAPVEHAPSSELRMRIDGARHRTPEGSDPLETKTNYFIGSDPARWRTNVANYRRVTYREILPGIDLVYHGDGRKLEYDFVVAPGASPKDIAVAYDGATSLSKTPDGELAVQLGAATLTQHKPVVYQDVGGRRRFVDASFRVLGKAKAGFEVADYDRSQPLVIDPVLVFSTYVGGAGNTDLAADAALTSNGSIAIGGYTNSTSAFATATAYDRTANATDGFVALLNATGTSLTFATYYGGNGADKIWAIAVDSADAIVGCGEATSGTGFPTTVGAYDVSANGGAEAFVFKLQSDGTALTFSTFMGGSGTDILYDVSVDTSNNVYATGYTTSANYPVTASNYHGDYTGSTNDVVVSKLSSTGASLLYSTYLGTAGVNELGAVIEPLSNGDILVAGYAYSADFPLAGTPVQTTFGGMGDVFVTEIDAAGTGLVASTLFGGNGYDTYSVGTNPSLSMFVGTDGAIYLTGGTDSTDFPTTTGAYQTAPAGLVDGFVVKLSADLSSKIYSTLIGGTGDDILMGSDLDRSSGRIAAAVFASTGFPMVHAIQSAYGGGARDAAVVVLDATGASLQFSTFLGGSGQDFGANARFTSTNRIAVASYCETGFPVTSGALKTTVSGTSDMCVTVLSWLSVTPSNTASVVVGESKTFGAVGGGGTLTWSLPTNGSGSTQVAGVYTAGATPGTDVLRVTDSANSDSADVTITVYGALSLAPASVVLAPAAGTTFTASGGVGGNVFSFVSSPSGGTLDSSTGAYVAGSTAPSTDVVRVTDSGGHTTTATVYVSTAVGLAPASATVAPRESKTFTGSGGTPPYTFALPTNGSGGSINASTGVYTAGSTGSTTDVVSITDAVSAPVATSTVTVTAGVTYAGNTSIAYAGSDTIVVTGGSGSGYTYTFTTNSSGGTLDSSTGAYAPGPTGGGTDVIVATDSLGNTATISISVAATPAMTLTPTTATLPPRDTQTFTAGGGAGVFGGYTYTVLTNNSGGTIDSNGVYTAGSTGGVTDTVQASDTHGHSVTSTVTVTAGVSLSGTSVTPRGSHTFAASGGRGTGFTYQITTDNSHGSIGSSSGVYTAGSTGSVTDVITVTDSLGNTATANAIVGAVVSLVPASPSVAPRGSQTFVASGGSSTGFSFQLTTDNSQGSIGASTGVYVAGDAGGVTDVITVTDSLGNTRTANITVTAGVSLAPASATVAPRGSQTFAASGGSGTGFSYQLTTDNSHGSIGASTGVYIAGSTGGVTDVITVTDSLGNTRTANITVTAGVSLTPASASAAPRGSQTFAASGGSGTGFSYQLTTDNSHGSIGASTGVYIAGSTGGVTDVITVTDSLGNTRTANITVTAGVSLTPASATVAPRGSQTFAASGGSGTGFSYQLTTDNSHGSIGASTGVYIAGSTGGVTDVITVTDSLGNTRTANITVTAGVSLTPASASVAPRGSQTFAASGGSGTGFSYQLTTDNSHGSIDSSTGAYVAGTTGGVTDTVTATDSLGNTATANIAVGPTLVISPATSTVTPKGSQVFSAQHGSGTGYAFSLTTNLSGGSIDQTSGAYTAGSAGNVTDVVTVTDSLNNTATRDVHVGPGISVTAPTPSPAPRSEQTLSASGGSAQNYQYALSVDASGASFNPATQLYRAGSLGSVTDVITVTDSLGNVGSVSLHVSAGVSLSPANASVAPRVTQHFSASGGSGLGFTFALATDASGASINASTGDYRAGNTGGVTDLISVTDSLGNTATASIGVGAGITLSPASLTVAPGGAQTFSAAGGSSTSYSFDLLEEHSGGTIDSSSGAYLAGRFGSVTDVVRVIDSNGATATASVSVGPVVSLSPASSTLAPLGHQSFSVAGGSGLNYTYAFLTHPSGGSLDANSGAYIAGPTGSVTDTVQVTDSLGNTASSSIAIGPALTLVPTTLSIPPRGSQSFVATDGAGGYAFTFNANGSNASLDANTGLYTAGSAPNTQDTIAVTDQNGARRTAVIAIGAGIELTATPSAVPPRGSASFGATGGSGTGYHYALTTAPSGGSIDSSSGAYVAGATDDVADVVTVTDSLGNTASFSIAVGNAVALNPPTVSLPPRGSQTFTAVGGSGTGFEFELSGGSGGSVDASSGVYSAGNSGDCTDTITVTDSLGNTATAIVQVGSELALSPATLTLPPRASQNLAINGGSGLGYAFTLATTGSGSDATIDMATGAYVAGSVPSSTDVILATDSLGNTVELTVHVGAGVTVSAAATYVPPRGRLDLAAVGGSGHGYSYALTNNASNGSVIATTGSYTAGVMGDVQDVVTATDSLGNFALFNIDVGAPVVLDPATPGVGPRGSLEFSARGGSGAGFVFALSDAASGGRIDASSGAYTAGPISDVTDVATVTDSLHNVASVSVAVGGALSVSPATAHVAPRQSLNLVATGGVSDGYAFELSSNASGASVDARGHYTAGPHGDRVDVVTVSDAGGNLARALLTVGAEISIAPADAALAPRGRAMFTIAGGGGDYLAVLRTNASGASLDATSGEYVAGPLGDVTDEISVTDQFGAEARAVVQISTALALSETHFAMPPSSAVDVRATGGAPPYHFAIATNASGARINPQTGQYTAGTKGAVRDLLQVTDANGAQLHAEVDVGPAIKISPMPKVASLGETIQFEATGGSGTGYRWKSEGGTIDMRTGLFTAPTEKARSRLVVEVTDSLGNSARLSFALESIAASTRPSDSSCEVRRPRPTRGSPLSVFALLGLALARLSRRWRAPTRYRTRSDR